MNLSRWMNCRVKPGNDDVSVLHSSAHLPCRLQDPFAVQRQRRDAGEAAAAVGHVGSGRPADDADNRRASLLVLEHRPAGIAGAGPHPLTRTLTKGIDKTDLQRARL